MSVYEQCKKNKIRLLISFGTEKKTNKWNENKIKVVKKHQNNKLAKCSIAEEPWRQKYKSI